jgi:hypothetical protein
MTGEQRCEAAMELAIRYGQTIGSKSQWGRVVGSPIRDDADPAGLATVTGAEIDGVCTRPPDFYGEVHA